MAPVYRPARLSFVSALTIAAALLCATARAQTEPGPDDKALATVLFQEGRTLMSAGHIAEACQKLEESQRLDPGGGTILNLALCHEQDGRLARSWAEFNQAIVAARKDGRRDREAAAAEQLRALEPRLSKLTVVVPLGTQVDGLRVECDGRELGQGAWSTPMPVDGGQHVVRATAPGKEPFAATIVIAKEADAQTVDIPVLATPVLVVKPPRVAAPPPPPAPMPAPGPSSPRMRQAGMVTAAVGVVALGLGGYALGSALGAKSDSNSDCTPAGVCGPTGLQQRNDAVSRGNWATLFGLGGVALVGMGATLFYLGDRVSPPKLEARIPTRFVLGAAPGAGMAGIAGGF
jgi:hypothetical protein